MWLRLIFLSQRRLSFSLKSWLINNIKRVKINSTYKSNQSNRQQGALVLQFVIKSFGIMVQFTRIRSVRSIASVVIHKRQSKIHDEMYSHDCQQKKVNPTENVLRRLALKHLNFCYFKLIKDNIIKMKTQPSLTLKETYNLSHNIRPGQKLSEYQVQKKYFDPLRQIELREIAKIKKGQKNRKHVTKRGNFLDDEARDHKHVPGPGMYPKQDLWPQKKKLPFKYPDRVTTLEQHMKHEKKEKIPAPGIYNVIKTLKQQEADKKILASKKINHQDRISYLDEIQYEANQTPGVGNYNPRKRVQTEGSKIKVKPEQWRKKHKQQEKKKLPKSPDMRTYHPQPSSYELFDGMKKEKSTKNFLGKVERFKTLPGGSGLNPAKYNVIQQWRGKDTKKKIERHGLEAISKFQSKSVYYH